MKECSYHGSHSSPVTPRSVSQLSSLLHSSGHDFTSTSSSFLPNDIVFGPHCIIDTAPRDTAQYHHICINNCFFPPAAPRAVLFLSFFLSFLLSLNHLFRPSPRHSNRCSPANTYGTLLATYFVGWIRQYLSCQLLPNRDSQF